MNNEFPMNRWLKNDVQVFQPKIIDIGVNYTVFLNFGHVYGFQFKEVPVEVLIESPSGAIERVLVPLQILDQDNQDVGECLGDICDIKHPLKENFRFTEQGVYTFSVSNQFDNVFLPNVLAVGIAIEKVE
jgi:gliding motility-associated lipoprotein GldH